MLTQDNYRLKIVAVLLKPTIRYCLRAAIGVYEVLEVMKQVFVEAAAEEIKARGEKFSVSRLSLMTGLPRRETRRISLDRKVQEIPTNIVSRVVGQWEQNNRFTTKAKKPRALTFGSEGGEFEQLVQTVSKDIGPAGVLCELERLGLVERVRNRVNLIKAFAIFQGAGEKGVALLSRDTGRFVFAVEENLFQPQDPKNLHLATNYDNVLQSELENIRLWLLREGEQFHKRARDYIARYDKDINPSLRKEGGGKVAVVAFSWTTTDSDKF